MPVGLWSGNWVVAEHQNRFPYRSMILILPLSVRAAIKPLSTLTKPLRSVDTATGEPAQAHKERTDSTVVPAAAVVAEAMVCLVLAGCYREKFGGDHIDDVVAALDAYRERIGWQ